jgi:alkylmercury lyase
MDLTLDDISDAVIAALPKLSAVEQRVSLAAYRLLVGGQPVTAEQISSASGVARDAVAEMLGRWHGVERDEDGAVTGFWGLTLATTKHRFRVGGRQLHTWCAWDTLFLPALLGAPADVESRCPASGQRIELKIGPAGVEAVLPEAVALSFLVPNEADIERNVIESFCCYVHFFASAEMGEEWASRRAGTFILALDEAWQIGARKNAAQFTVPLAP